jgi:WD40 repeat protein
MCVRFNENDTTEIMSNGEIRVFFWRSCLPATAAFQYYSPPLASADFKQKIGKFTASTFIPGTKQAVTGTCDGDVVVWDAQGVAAEIGTRAEDRKATKLVRLHLKSITWLSSIGDFIVSGGGDGFVRFFDPMLRLIAWFEHINAGPICAVSFSCATLKPDPAAAANLDHFLCPDFVCSTANGCIVSLTAAAFNTPDAVSRCGQILLAGLPRQITACIAHPMQPLFLVIGACGTMQLWDSHLHAPTLNIPPPLASSKDALRPKCAVYSRTGTVVVVGCADGAVFVLNAADLSEVVRIKQSKAPICTVAISTSGKHFAAATDDGHVLLANLVPFKHTLRWEFIGRAKVHYTRIIAVHFGEAPSGETRCFSLSEDGCLSEYNLTTSSLEAGVVVCNQLVLPHPAAPSAMSFTPPLSYYEQGVIDTQLVIADSALAIRVFNPDTAVTSSTLRGPTFGGPLVQLAMFQTAANSATLVAFRCGSSVYSIHRWLWDVCNLTLAVPQTPSLL